MGAICCPPRPPNPSPNDESESDTELARYLKTVIDIHYVLQEHFKDEFFVPLFGILEDEEMLCRLQNQDDRVAQNKTSRKMFSRLSILTKIIHNTQSSDSYDIVFLFVWHIEEEWYIGSPYFPSDKGKFVKFASNKITFEVAGPEYSLDERVISSVDQMLGGSDNKESGSDTKKRSRRDKKKRISNDSKKVKVVSRFIWSRRDSDDNSFQVFKCTNDASATWYWKREGAEGGEGGAIMLTEGLGDNFKFIESSN